MDDPATRSIVLFDRDLRTADTVGPLPAAGPRDHTTDLLAGSDGTTLYLALQSSDGAVVARVARLTGSTLGLQILPRDSITGMWLLPDARTLVVAAVTNQPSGIRQGTLRLLPADVADTGPAVRACSGSVAGFTSLGRRGRAYAGCDMDTIVEIDITLGLAVRTVGVSADPASQATCGTTDVASSPNGTIVYVLCREAGTLLYLDRLTLTALTEVDVGVGASAVVLTPDGRRAIVTRPPSSEVVVVDLRRREVRSRVIIPDVRRAVIGSESRYAYTVSTGRGSQPGRLAHIDLENGLLLTERAISATASLLSLWPATGTPHMRWSSLPAFQTPKP